jgi:hypothetical protein
VLYAQTSWNNANAEWLLFLEKSRFGFGVSLSMRINSPKKASTSTSKDWTWMYAKKETVKRPGRVWYKKRIIGVNENDSAILIRNGTLV